MPVSERYYKELLHTHEEAERQAQKDTRREWIRVLAQIFLWTTLGLVGIALAFHVYDESLGWVYWWAGAFVWVAGWCVTMLTAYRRGVRRGDWK
ncbi:MAG: hypothetical protein ACRENH_01510 [Gemmatimonadaceae bacterium]